MSETLQHYRFHLDRYHQFVGFIIRIVNIGVNFVRGKQV